MTAVVACAEAGKADETIQRAAQETPIGRLPASAPACGKGSFGGRAVALSWLGQEDRLDGSRGVRIS